MDYWAQVATLAGIQMILAFSFYAPFRNGQFAMSQATFMGIGAYGSAVLTVKYGAPFPMALLASMVLGGIAGWLLGTVLAERVKGLYLSVATLAVGEALVNIYTQWEFIGGGIGLRGIRLDTGLPLVLFCDVVVLFLFHQIDRSVLGRVSRACADDPMAAEMSTINVRAIRISTLSLSGILGGLAGALYAHLYGNLMPSDFGLSVNLDAMLAVIMGGTTTMYGPLLGSAIVATLPELLRAFSVNRSLVFGALLIVIMIVRPQGLLGKSQGGQWTDALTRLTERFLHRRAGRKPARPLAQTEPDVEEELGVTGPAPDH